MRIVAAFPRPVREIENVWIKMPDGVRLAARIWMPEDAEARPVPAILEYIPYRKRDLLRSRDEPIHRYFAGHGYAAVRLDLRGTGESEGILRDEYLPQELDDAEAAIKWIASQPWCDGAVGMFGKSWGGFNGLQVGARNPAALKAIVTVASTDDRYADDAHYMGGCLINENLSWGSAFFNLMAQPPDPALVGDEWRAMWRERLEAAHPVAAEWMRHPDRDDYWQHGSVCENFAAIECAVYAVGGWADAYTNAIPRLLAGLTCPRKGLIGPWGHQYPQDGVPGPAIGFLQEALRWWDCWLKGAENGVMDEPMLRVWMQDGVVPRPDYEVRPGRWVAEDTWPSPRIETRSLSFAPGRLIEGAKAGDAGLHISSPQSVGLASGAWCGFGAKGEMPTDQRIDDGRSLTFDSEPLAEDIEILGAPVVELEISSDRPQAMVAVRLCDLHPDGASERVTYGLLNLSHRDGHAAPKPLEPGRRIKARVQLNDAAHAFAAGHRLRIAVSTGYWPIAWPSPEKVALTIFTGQSRFALPVRPPRAEDAALHPFAAPEAAPGPTETRLRPAQVRRAVEHDLSTHEVVHASGLVDDDLAQGGVTRIEEIDLEIGQAMWRRLRIRDDDPLSARAELRNRTEFKRESWNAVVETRTTLTATADEFVLEAELNAYEGHDRVFTRAWQERIKRECA
jgi:uncharacterized protein